MTFLAPGTGLLAAAIALPLLLLLYFLKLRRRTVRVSSVLFFDARATDDQANVPLRMIRPTLLLLLQLLALACLICALARPVLLNAGVAGDVLVLMIDRSASMNAADSPVAQTRLDEARLRALDVIDRLAPGQQAVVVTFASTAEALTGVTASRALLRRAVEDITPTDEPGNLALAMDLARSLAPRPGGTIDELTDPARPEESSKPPACTIVLITDGGFADDGDAAAGTSSISAGGNALVLEIVGPVEQSEPARQAAEPSADDATTNIGIVAFSAVRSAEDPTLVRVFCKLSNSARVERTARVRLSLDGAPLDALTVVVPPSPGTQIASSSLRLEGGGIVSASLLAPDALSADDTATLILHPAPPPAVLVVTQDGSTDPAEMLDPFLRSSLSSLAELKSITFRVVSLREYERLALAGLRAPDRSRTLTAFRTSTPATSAEQPAASLLIFDRARPSRLAPVPSLSFGAGLPSAGPRAPSVVASPPASVGSERLLVWQREHPLLRGVPMDALVLRPGARLTPDAAARNGEEAQVNGESANLSTLAASPSGDVIAVRTDPLGVQRVLVAFTITESNFGTLVGFPLFVSNAIETLTLRSRSLNASSERTGVPIRVRPLPGQVVVVNDQAGPRRFEPSTTSLDDDGLLGIGAFSRVGLVLLSGVEPRDAALAINLLDAVESSIAVGRSVPVTEIATPRGRGVGDGSLDVSWYFVLACAAVLVPEFLLALAGRRRPVAD